MKYFTFLFFLISFNFLSNANFIQIYNPTHTNTNFDISFTLCPELNITNSTENFHLDVGNCFISAVKINSVKKISYKLSKNLSDDSIIDTILFLTDQRDKTLLLFTRNPTEDDIMLFF